MELRKRHRPHTPEEWEAIRPDFTELYQVQGKKLSEVMKIFEGRGFHAQKCHYDIRIKKWGLRKNNRESEMVFAVQRLEARAGKRTDFTIRGKALDRKEIRRYWRRRRLNPGQFSPVAQTPPGVEYYTPKPSPGSDISVNSPAEDTTTSEDSDMIMVWTPASLFAEPNQQSVAFSRAIRDTIFTTQQSASLRVIEAPEPFRAQDHALRCSKAYYTSKREAAWEHQHWYDFLGRSKALGEFLDAAVASWTARRYELAPVHAEVAYMDLIRSIPDVIKEADIMLIPRWLGRISKVLRPVERSRGAYMRVIARVSMEMVNQSVKEYGSSDPLTMLLQAIDALLEQEPPILEKILLVGKDELAQVADDDHASTQAMLGELAVVCWCFLDFNGSLRYAKQLRQIHYQSSPSASLSFEDVLLLDMIVSCHIELGNQQEANELVDNGLEESLGFHERHGRDYVRALFLQQRGHLLFINDDLDGAFSALNEALRLQLNLVKAGILKANHPTLVGTAIQLQEIQEKQAQRDRHRVDCSVEEVED